jgi:hypothetical protein
VSDPQVRINIGVIIGFALAVIVIVFWAYLQ